MRRRGPRSEGATPTMEHGNSVLQNRYAAPALVSDTSAWFPLMPVALLCSAAAPTRSVLPSPLSATGVPLFRLKIVPPNPWPGLVFDAFTYAGEADHVPPDNEY